MKNLNLFRKSARGSEGSTLASAVVRQSFDRRLTVVKHLAFMLLFLLGSLNVWGETAIITFANQTSGTSDGSAAYTTSNFVSTGIASSDDAFGTITCSATDKCYSGKVNMGLKSGAKSSAGSFTISFSTPVTNVSQITLNRAAYNTSKSATITVKNGSTTLADAVSTGTNASLNNMDITDLNIASLSGLTVETSKYCYIKSITITYTPSGSSNPTVSLTPTNKEFEATGNSAQEIAISTSNFASAVNSVTCAFYSEATCTNLIDRPTWVNEPTVNNEKTKVTVNVADNDGNARQTWMKITVSDGSESASAVFAISQKKYSVDYATLPFAYDGNGSGDLPNGFTNSGVGTYNTSPAMKFDGTGDNVIVHFNAAPGTLTYDIKGNSFSGGTFTVQESEDGTDYTEVASYTSLSDVQNEEYDLNSASRYVKFIYTIKSSGNVALGNIAISEYVAPAAVAKPTISGETPFLTSTTVTLTQAEADAIYYTTDGSDPKTSETKQTYSAPFTVNAEGTTTVKAYAVKGSDVSAIAEATFTKQTVLTVAQALVEATGSGKYVTGTITSITEVNIGYKNATYVISDISAGIPQNEMIVYRGKYIGGADFTSADQIHVGDVVVVSGSIAVHAEKNQMAQGNQIVTISVPAVAAPVFEPNGGGFVISTDVTIAAAGADHIYYTTNGDNPTKASSEYTGAIHLDATTTIKAIAYIGEESSLVVEKTFTLTDPKTVAEAYDELVSADLENVAVEGYVYQIDEIKSGNATYWISDDGNAGAKVLEVFKGKGIEGADVAAGDIREGDKVIVFGTLTIYTGGSEDVKEFKQGSRLLSLTRKTVESVAVTGTPSKTSYKTGQAFEPAGLTVTVTYNDNSHATVAAADCDWEITPATFDAAGTGLSVSVKATYDGVQSPAYLVEGLTVKAVPTFDDPNYEWQLVTSDAQLVAGKYYVLASTAQSKVAGAISSDILGTVSATIADGAIAYNAFGTDQTADAASAVVFELGGTTGAWTLNEAIDELGQLAYKEAKKVKWETESTAAWAITIADNNATLVPAAANTYHMLYNVSSPRFTIYTSAPAANMLLPQLYVWALKTYKLRYDANGGEDAPAAQAADGEGKATVTDAKPTKEDYIFKEWNTLVEGDGEAKAAGDVIDLSAGDVTLYAQWREPNTYSISYDANGGTLVEGESEIAPNPESVTEGNSYTVKANVYEVEGKIFMGWKAADVIYNAGQVIHPTEDMAFVAQWGNPNVTDFMLVTDAKQLKDGDKVYIVADGNYNVALGELNGSVRNPVEIAKSNAHIVNIGNNPVELTLGKDGNDYTFYDGANYLAWISGNTLTNASSVSDNSTWNITISEGVTKIANKDDGTREIRYNSGSPRFAAYAGTQQHVSIYKRPDYSRDVTEGRYGTICLPKAGKIEGAELYEVAYKDLSQNKIFFDQIVNGEMIAGRPYVFLPKPGTAQLAVYYTDNTAVDAAAEHYNGLYGFIGADPTDEFTIPQSEGYYIIQNNQYREVQDGVAKIVSNRAYLKMLEIPGTAYTPLPGRKRMSIGAAAPAVATGVENVQGDNVQCTKVLINGHLFILRGEKMYDAKGQLVK